MCEPRNPDCKLKVYHSAECLINDEEKPNRRHSVRASSHSMVKRRTMLFDGQKREAQKRFSTNHYEGSDHSGIGSFVEQVFDAGESECTRKKQTSRYVSDEELFALRGCVSRRRMLFSPNLSQETSSSMPQVVCVPTSDFLNDKFEETCCHRYSSPRCDNVNGYLLCESVTNPIPDSVSVQFDRTFYDSETVCESTSKHHQERHTGLNVAVTSRSECNINMKSTDFCKQHLENTPLSCSIPVELNASTPQFEHQTRSPDMKQDTLHQSWGVPLIHAKDQTLYGSWPCRHLHKCKKKNSTCSLCACNSRHASLLTTSSVSRHVTTSLQSRQRSLYPCLFSSRGTVGMKSSISSLLDVASTLSISSCHSASDPSLSLGGRQHISYSTGVDGQVFKDKTEVSSNYW